MSAPFFRDFSQTFNGKTYMITLDGDFQMVYYRTDVLQKLGMQPPKTWDDYLAIAKAAHGKDLNGDGKPDYGSCISKKRNAQAYWCDHLDRRRLSSRPRAPRRAPSSTPTNMKPLINNEGFRQALEIYQGDRPSTARRTRSTSTSAIRASLFTSGQCALTPRLGRHRHARRSIRRHRRSRTRSAR